MSNQYSAETKAAVIAALLSGQSVSAVADEYNIPLGTVKSWKSRQKNGDSVAKVATIKKEMIGDLILEYLAASLTTLKAQVEMFSNEEWIAKQNAADVAVLHGVVTDKAVRLLEALATSEE